jgi:hypothetical protein
MNSALEIDYRHWTTETGEVSLLATGGVYEYLDAAAVHASLAVMATTWMPQPVHWCSWLWHVAARTT